MKEYQEMLGQALKGIREDKGYVQDKMAELLGVSLRYYQDLESGKKLLGTRLLCKLIYDLKINPDIVFAIPHEPNTNEYQNLMHLLRLCTPEQIHVISVHAQAFMEYASKQ